MYGAWRGAVPANHMRTRHTCVFLPSCVIVCVCALLLCKSKPIPNPNGAYYYRILLAPHTHYHSHALTHLSIPSHILVAIPRYICASLEHLSEYLALLFFGELCITHITHSLTYRGNSISFSQCVCMAFLFHASLAALV